MRYPGSYFGGVGGGAGVACRHAQGDAIPRSKPAPRDGSTPGRAAASGVFGFCDVRRTDSMADRAPRRGEFDRCQKVIP
jgi:hypothetical protein